MSESTLLISIVIGAVAALIVGVWLGRRFANARLLDEFAERFPDDCPICSFHRFGLTHGFRVPPSVELHEGCKEGNPYAERIRSDEAART